MIEVKNLSKHYGNLHALKNINLSVKDQEIYGFIGPNGAGKSTTLKILATLTRDYEGKVSIAGIPLNGNKKEVRKQIGFMPDMVGLYRRIYVWEYMDFFCRAYSVPKNKRKSIINDCLSLVDLTEKRDARVGHLSRGMTQRLLLAKTLVHNPKVLFLDEPASGLDPRARIELLALLKELKAMGKTILISSHILAEMEDLCDRFGIIEAGEMVCEGSLEEIHDIIYGGNYISIAFYRKLTNLEKKFLTSINYLTESDPNGIEYKLLHKGTDEELADIIKEIVKADLPLISFSSKQYNLDDVFLKITKGKVQ